VRGRFLTGWVLHALAEVVGDHDPPLWRGLVVNEQFRAAAIALPAQ
jgi:hypothetical protein